MRLESFIKDVEVGEPYFAKNMLIFPLEWRGELANGNGIITLNEAFEQGILEIKETGDISSALLEYRGENPLFIVDGEPIYGALQDRVVNTAIWARSSVRSYIPVSCIEEGRWSGERVFHSSRFSVFPSLRAVLASSVTDSLRKTRMFETGRRKVQETSARRTPGRQAGTSNGFNREWTRFFHADQGRVWQLVNHSIRAYKVTSNTLSLKDIFESPKVKNRLDEYIEEVEVGDRTVGLMAFVEDRLLAVDIFGKPSLLKKLKDKIVSGYAIDAMLAGGRSSKIGEDEAMNLLRKLGDTEFEEYDGAVHGRELRFKDKDFVARALVDDAHSLLHLSAFDLKTFPNKPSLSKGDKDKSKARIWTSRPLDS